MKKPKINYGYNKYGFSFIPNVFIGYAEYAWNEHKREYSFSILFLRYYFEVSIDIKHQNPE